MGLNLCRCRLSTGKCRHCVDQLLCLYRTARIQTGLPPDIVKRDRLVGKGKTLDAAAAIGSEIITDTQ